MSDRTSLRLPGFIHVGPTRTGTTWLHEVLKGHVGLPRVKETRFFDVQYDRGVEWYCSLFDEYPADVPAGEMGPTYFSNAIARERIKHHLPDSRIILTFREPAARQYSVYRLSRSLRRPVNREFDGHWRLLINAGADLCGYATQLKRWQATFGESRVLVLFYDDLSSNPQSYLDSVCDFIGARRIVLNRSPVGSGKVYSAPATAGAGSIAGRMATAVDWAAQHGAAPLIKLGQRTPLWNIVRRPFVEEFPPLSEESADEIRAIMLPEIEELEQITGRDLSRWKAGKRYNFDNGHGDTNAAARTLGQA
jgi:Sulfotransferase domain